MPELIPINIVVADRSYRLKIEPTDEEQVRKTALLINDKINEFKTHFAGKDIQDYIAMVLLWFATQQKENSHSVLLTQDAAQQITDLTKLIDKALTEI
ncbi:MAG: cell division protein ZapA [Sphingobacteriia bacterium]|nr:MAG: cell division protein ZapA [Sphingobacteriia bacterium]TAG30228.1 MAG: cell division protein ZapA [Sphingobacteriia bacterium]TAH08639.1 MAG: cell division protein ZapA [Sphingobacteriia bacterium]